MLGKQTKVDIRMAVLEEKLSVYEQMINKIQDAIEVISTNSQSISKMLAIHDERINYSNKSDAEIIVKLKELEEKNTIEHGKSITKMEGIEQKIEGLSNFKWMLVGIGIVTSIVVTTISTLASGIIKLPDTSHPLTTIPQHRNIIQK